MESGPDKLARVQQMAIDTGETWDLSPKDQIALRHILGLVRVMSEDLARSTKATPELVLNIYHDVVERHHEALK